MRVFGTVLGLCLLLGACGDPVSPGPPSGAGDPPGEDVYVADSGFVLDDGKQVKLCLGAIAESLPPQCGTMPITNWSWDDVENEESASGSTWGSYRITGTYDGTSFTLTQSPEPPESDDVDDYDLTAPCDEPDGGWVSPDPAKSSEEDRIATLKAARQEPDYAESWIDYLDDPQTDVEAMDSEFILVMAFTGDLERHEAVAQTTWGGLLCLVQHDRTYSELRRVQHALGTNELATELGYEMLTSGIDVAGNEIQLHVVLATPELERTLDERFGEGTIDLDSALRPAG